jgi:hypothetical protein
MAFNVMFSYFSELKRSIVDLLFNSDVGIGGCYTSGNVNSFNVNFISTTILKSSNSVTCSFSYPIMASVIERRVGNAGSKWVGTRRNLSRHP